MAAFDAGQVDALVIAATPEAVRAQTFADTGRSNVPERSAGERTANELVARARNTAAKIRFVEDISLLEPIGGVGAFLRFRV